jgi:hypothetical protein
MRAVGAIIETVAKCASLNERKVIRVSAMYQWTDLLDLEDIGK